MKKIILLSLLAVTVILTGYSQQNLKGNQQAKVLVYFFHGTHRCIGCLNAEKATVAVLNELYKSQQEKGIIRFLSINVEEDKNKAMAEKYDVAFNMLLIVPVADPDKRIELTQEAFAYGTNPAGLKPIIQSALDPLIR